MKDKWILVTGSSSGIGNAITIKLLDLGAKVVGIARDHKKFIIQLKKLKKRQTLQMQLEWSLNF